MKKAIQFGAGNIGRGFIGAVLEQAGYHVVFADVNEQVVARINSDRAYTVQIMDTVCEQMRITDISAMDSRSPELAAQIAGAELVTTAVGLTVLPRIAGAIAAGIAARRDAGVTEPLNVIACENGVRATTQLREAVLKHLDEAPVSYTHLTLPTKPSVTGASSTSASPTARSTASCRRSRARTRSTWSSNASSNGTSSAPHSRAPCPKSPA